MLANVCTVGRVAIKNIVLYAVSIFYDSHNSYCTNISYSSYNGDSIGRSASSTRVALTVPSLERCLLFLIRVIFVGEKG